MLSCDRCCPRTRATLQICDVFRNHRCRLPPSNFKIALAWSCFGFRHTGCQSGFPEACLMYIHCSVLIREGTWQAHAPASFRRFSIWMRSHIRLRLVRLHENLELIPTCQLRCCVKPEGSWSGSFRNPNGTTRTRPALTRLGIRV